MYDFTGLAPHDFEHLCRDIISVETGKKFHVYSQGRDGGIDLRHSMASDGKWIGQCKHYARSSFSKLYSDLKNIELPKIRALAPQRYFLFTSVCLTPQQADRLCSLLSPYCLSTSDIIGSDTLNALIRDNEAIERQHYKLWLTSSKVLLSAVHSGLFAQQTMTQEDIQRRLRLLVPTSALDKAREHLAKNHVTVISGVPGIGKTTLAEMLLLDYISEGWELVTIFQNVSEGLSLWSTDKKTKQVFYYDDFLGMTSLGDKLDPKEDSTLLKMIDAVSRAGNKRFVLTTREYLLAQIREERERMRTSGIDVFKFVLELSDLRLSEKARILFNHMYYSDLSERHIQQVVETKAYRKILEHTHYNPRVVEWMTDYKRVAECRPKDYPQRFLENLDNPADLWAHAFTKQLTTPARNLLFALASCGPAVDVSQLEKAFNAFHRECAQEHNISTTPFDFSSALKEVEGTFVRIIAQGSYRLVQVYNPSVLDFVSSRVVQTPSIGRSLIQSSVFFEQFARTIGLITAGKWTQLDRLNRLPKDIALLERCKSLFDAEPLREVSLPTYLYLHVYGNQVRTVAERLRVCAKLLTQWPALKPFLVEKVAAFFEQVSRHETEPESIEMVVAVLRNAGWLGLSDCEVRNYVEAVEQFLRQFLGSPACFDNPSELESVSSALMCIEEWCGDAVSLERLLHQLVGEMIDSAIEDEPDRHASRVYEAASSICDSRGWDFARQLEELSAYVEDESVRDDDRAPTPHSSARLEDSMFMVDGLFRELVQ